MTEFTNIPQSEFNEERSFCSHEMSTVLDAQGGLCSLSYIDSYEKNGILYPDEKPLLILNRDGATCLNRPLYGPAIFLYTLTDDHREIVHHPVEQTISPWSLMGGDREQSFAFVMDSNRLFWNVSCQAPNAEKLFWCLQPSALFSGEKIVHMQQHTGKSSTQSGGLYSEEMLQQALSDGLLNGTAQVCWKEDSFDEKEQTYYLKGTVSYPFGIKEFYFAIGCSAPVSFEKFMNMTALCADWKRYSEITFVMALGSSKEEARLSMQEGTAQYGQILQYKKKTARKIEKESLQIKVAKLPEAYAFSQMSPQYLDSLMVGKTEEGYIGVCAAAHKFGYFSVWDSIYPIRDLLWNGRYEDACRQITYLLKLPMMDNTPIASLHAVLQWNEAMAFFPSMELEQLYPQITKMFWTAKASTEPTYHMLKYAANVGVDKPEELGLTGEFLSAEVNALWYAACRIVQNEALLRNDTIVYEAAREVVQGVEAGYEKVFFDPEAGYLRAAVNPDFSLPHFAAYQNTNTWGYDYPYGMYLMRNIVKPLAQYQATQLWHPLGHKSVSFDSMIPCEMWQQVHMNQHNGHEMKLQRMAGNMREVYRVMRQYLKRFDRWKVAEETTNFSRFRLHPAQVCSWQSFSATANLEALRCAVSGLIKHRGGIGYLPAMDDGEIKLNNVPWGGSKISVSITGCGAYAMVKIDEKPLAGTMQIPVDVVCQEVLIERTEELPNDIMLVAALDMPIVKVIAKKGFLQFTCGERLATPVCLASKRCPQVFLNGKPLDVQWDEETKMLWIDACWNIGDVVTAQIIDET